jgi:prepilin-type processing-associated H-X9-DG protein
MNATMLTIRTEIPQPHDRFVFVDDGGTAGATLGGWTCYTRWSSDLWKWWDPPPIRHGDGTTFSFADGHSEYYKWEDQRTLDFGFLGQAFSGDQNGNPDLVKSQIGCWGMTP